MNVKHNIVAIGGGQVFVPCKLPETLAIDKYIVGLAKDNLLSKDEARRPRILFIPTASGDDHPYCNTIYHIYEWLLGCEFDCLRLLAEQLTDEEISQKIYWADIIYVGGGNTDKMMCTWRQRGVDLLLIEAYNRGTVLCGLSAGAICWFENGISDSERLNNPESSDWEPTPVEGLGLISGTCCPHYDSEGTWRRQACENMLRHGQILRSIIAIEDLCALHVSETALTPISASDSGCYRLDWAGDALVSNKLTTMGLR